MNFGKKKIVKIIMLILVIVTSSLFLINSAIQSSKYKNNQILAPEVVAIDENPENDKVSFIGVGDNLIHDTVYVDAKTSSGSYDFTNMYSEIKPTISDADIAFINQETVIGGQNIGLSGYPLFNSPTELAKNLEEVGFDMVNLATNHSLDVGIKGIENQAKAFSDTKLVTTGVATSQEEADDIKIIEKNGIKFSFLSYTYGTNGIKAPNSYNVSYLSEEKIKKDIENAKNVSDAIIVSAHWGEENSFNSSGYQKKYAQIFADAGANLVVGHHPHTIQPVEWVTGKNGNETLVAYSLGNFLGGMLDVDNIIGGMLSLDFVRKEDSGKIEIENIKWIPIIIHFEGVQVDIMSSRKKYKIYLVKDYSEELAKKHVLNGYEDNVLNMKYINELTKKYINEKYL